MAILLFFVFAVFTRKGVITAASKPPIRIILIVPISTFPRGVFCVGVHPAARL